jgi:hypothetical protein
MTLGNCPRGVSSGVVRSEIGPAFLTPVSGGSASKITKIDTSGTGRTGVWVAGAIHGAIGPGAATGQLWRTRSRPLTPGGPSCAGAVHGGSGQPADVGDRDRSQMLLGVRTRCLPTDRRANSLLWPVPAYAKYRKWGLRA